MSESRVATIDAIEEAIARLEVDGAAVEVPRSLLPAGAREGDVIEIRVRPDLTASRRAQAPELHTDDTGEDLDV